ncbi:MAG TPA: FtsW/RodA/SpoVE family cell cycle protein, partial [Candidatus Paceibacterota bacterium]|nr:FtsW/RodA/SpoVE family cell cycle protein [Candidatus Paceibacterota bacterium]
MHLLGDRVFASIVALLVIGGAGIFLSAALGLLARESVSLGHIAVTQLLLGLIPGVIALLILRFMPPAWLQKLVVPLYLFSILLTCLVFVPGLGVHAGGATRWIDLGPFTV